MIRLLPVLFLLLFIAAAMRDDFALTLVYLIAAAAAAGAWWSSHSIAQVQSERSAGRHAFLGEKVPVRLRFRNQGWLPVLWLKVQDELPVGLSSSPHFAQITSLASGSATEMNYTLEARKRGYYSIGPLLYSTGDILGLHEAQKRLGAAQTLTVYPKIVPLSQVKISSRFPMGSLRHHQPVFEDPARIFGKREFTSGDSLRRVDWKSTAATGRLQVKLFEPSISLETVIFLDLNAEAYPLRMRIDSTELAIVIAASLANWIIGKHQSAGLRVNGRDPLADSANPISLPPAKGQTQLMWMLETLARVEAAEAGPLAAMIQKQRFNLPWGATLIAITGQVDESLLEELHQAQRAGQETLLIMAGYTTYDAEMTRRAAYFGIPMVWIANERGLDIWRR